jgi:hypothetical protein
MRLVYDLTSRKLKTNFKNNLILKDKINKKIKLLKS